MGRAGREKIGSEWSITGPAGMVFGSQFYERSISTPCSFPLTSRTTHPISHVRNTEAKPGPKTVHGQQEVWTEQGGAPGTLVAGLPRN